MQSSESEKGSLLGAAPFLIHEQQIRRFRFYREDAVQEGMVFSGQFYQLHEKLSIHDRLKAYQLSAALTEQGLVVVISLSSNHYHIWSVLKSSKPASPSAHPGTFWV